MSDFFVRIDDLADYSSTFSTLAADSQDALGNLMAGLGGFADAWGDDAPGQAFFAGYQAPATETLGLTAQMTVQLTVLSSAMAQTTADYLSTETTNTSLGSGATHA